MPVESPCIKVCTLDASGRTCTACGRTLEEIARWGGMTRAERRAVMERLAAVPKTPDTPPEA